MIFKALFGLLAILGKGLVILLICALFLLAIWGILYGVWAFLGWYFPNFINWVTTEFQKIFPPKKRKTRKTRRVDS